MLRPFVSVTLLVYIYFYHLCMSYSFVEERKIMTLKPTFRYTMAIKTCDGVSLGNHSQGTKSKLRHSIV